MRDIRFEASLLDSSLIDSDELTNRVSESSAPVVVPMSCPNILLFSVVPVVLVELAKKEIQLC